jgi:hypothetical protein
MGFAALNPSYVLCGGYLVVAADRLTEGKKRQGSEENLLQRRAR